MGTYSFRDIVDHTNYPIPTPSEAISLDGSHLDGVLEGYLTLSVSGRESLEYNIEADDMAAGVDGENYRSKRLPAREITCNFYLEAPDAITFAARYRKLKNLLQGENRKISFDDEPNLYYVGTIEAMDKPTEGLLSITSNFTFYCADPHAMSNVKAENTVFSWDGTNKIATVNLANKGTLPTFPLITINHKSENGYIGVVSENGVLEIGNKQEVDGTTQTKSETFLSAHSQADFGALKKSTMSGSPQPIPVITNGTLAWQTDGIRLTNSGTGNTTWHGGALEYDIPADSAGHTGAANFYSSFQLYCSSKAYQLGIFQLWFCDVNNLPICGYEVMKNVQTNTQAHSKFWVGNGKDNNVSLFKQNDFDINDNQMFTSSTGWADVTKEGADISFYWYGSKYKTTVPAIAGMECRKVYVVIGQWQYANNTVDHLMDNLSLKAFTFSKTNEAYYRDVPNRYAAGSNMVIDMGAGKVFYNGIAANDQLVVGSEFFGIPPGTSTLALYFSSFMQTAPAIDINWTERYL